MHDVPGPRPYLLVLLGGIVLATLDLLFARIYWDSAGVTFARVFQSVATGIFGKASREGGAFTVAVGALCHYAIATCMVLACYWASRKWPLLHRRPLTMGAIYGVFLYFFMNLVVLPLSAAGMPSFADRSWVVWSIFMHAVFGVICTGTARLANRNRAELP